jgi:hypothetical protein
LQQPGIEVLSYHSLTPPPRRPVPGTGAFIGLTTLVAASTLLTTCMIATFGYSSITRHSYGRTLRMPAKDRILSHIIRSMVVTLRSGELRMLTRDNLYPVLMCERSEVKYFSTPSFTCWIGWKAPSTRPITSLNSHFSSHCFTVHICHREEFLPAALAGSGSKSPVPCPNQNIAQMQKPLPSAVAALVEEFKNQICTFFMSSSSPLTPNPLT